MSKQDYKNFNIFEVSYLKKNKLPNLLLCFSNDFDIYSEIFTYYARQLQSLNGNTDIIKLNGMETSLSHFFSCISTPSLFSNYYLVGGRHIDYLMNLIEAEKSYLLTFKNYIANMHKNLYLILQFDAKKLTKQLQFLDDFGLSVGFKKMYEKDTLSFLHTKIKNLDIKSEQGVLELLMELCAMNNQSIQQIIDQIILYIGEKKHITRDTVHLFCRDVKGDLYFSILDLVAQKNISKCLTKISQHQFTDARQIVAGIAQLFVNAYQYFYLEKASSRTDEIDHVLGMNLSSKFIVQKNKERLKGLLFHYPIQNFSKIFYELHKLDNRVRSEPSAKHISFLVSFLAHLDSMA